MVYVDDMLVAAEDTVMKGFMDRLQQEWKTSPPEMVNGKEPVVFCGVEICEREGGFWLGQSAYIRDLVERHRDVKNVDVPAGKMELSEEPEEDRTLEEVKEAQVALGELLWVSTRTRPDVAFAVGQASRMVAKYPKKALSVAKQILGYLKNTDDVGIIYQKRMEPREEEAEFPGPRSMGTLEIQADVSFAPGGGRSIQGVMVLYGGGIIAWESTRQAFTTLSTAEAELTGYVQATAIGEAVATLVELLEGSKVKKMILGDNAAAISIITTPACAWRSRHLRCRAGRLAELIEEEEWRLRHLPGTLLAADGLTKPLAKIQFEKCRGGMGLEVRERKKVKKAFGEKVVGAAGWLAVDKLKAVVGMLSLVAVAKAEDGEEPELEGVSLEVILTVIAILVVVIWELTKKACGVGMKKLKRPVEDPDKELARPHEEAKSPPKQGLGDRQDRDWN